MRCSRVRRKWLSIFVLTVLGTVYFTMDVSIYPLNVILPNIVTDAIHKILKQRSHHCPHGQSLKHIQKNISSGHFPLIVPYIEPDITCEDRLIHIPVVVNSAASGDGHRRLRATIRQTWGDLTGYSDEKKWRLFFSLGLCSDEKENELNTQEALENNDIIIGNFTDIYKNVVYKTFMGLSWAYSKFSCQYIMKTDDDVYVRIPEVIHWLHKSGSPTPFYGGSIDVGVWVMRHPNSPWYTTREQYNETFWPPFALGAFEVFCTVSLPRYFNYTQHRRPFRTDDTYLGLAAKEFGIRAVNIPGFYVSIKLKSYCDLLNITAIGHRLDPKTIVRYHSFYRNNTARKICLG